MIYIRVNILYKKKNQLLEYYYIVMRKYFFIFLILIQRISIELGLVKSYKNFEKCTFLKKLKFYFSYFIGVL